MLMNDTTFLLDESMDALKRIHEVQQELDDNKKWAEQSQETQQTRLRNLSQDERQCRSYLTLVCTARSKSNRTLAILKSKMAFFNWAWWKVKVLPCP